MATPSKKKQNLPLKWYFQNPVCLTFCSVTRSIFHVGRKVRWVLKSSSPGLLKNGQKFFCMYSGTRENNKIEVQTVLLDTLYLHQIFVWQKYLHFACDKLGMNHCLLSIAENFSIHTMKAFWSDIPFVYICFLWIWI